MNIYEFVDWMLFEERKGKSCSFLRKLDVVIHSDMAIKLLLGKIRIKLFKKQKKLDFQVILQNLKSIQNPQFLTRFTATPLNQSSIQNPN